MRIDAVAALLGENMKHTLVIVISASVLITSVFAISVIEGAKTAESEETQIAAQ